MKFLTLILIMFASSAYAYDDAQRAFFIGMMGNSPIGTAERNYYNALHPQNPIPEPQQNPTPQPSHNPILVLDGSGNLTYFILPQ